MSSDDSDDQELEKLKAKGPVRVRAPVFPCACVSIPLALCLWQR
jgi:hypothetical protein